MKLLNIILEDEDLSVKNKGGRSSFSDLELKQSLINSPNASGLTFNNVEIESKYEGEKRKKYIIKNYSCKKHPKWFGTEWRYYDDVRGGRSGCKICEVERRDIDKPKLKQTLIDSPNASGLTFNNVEIESKYVGEIRKTYVKNYSCKIHPEWIGTEWRYYNDVKKGTSGCKICEKGRKTGGRKIIQKTNEQLKKELQSSPNTTGLTFNDANFKYDTQQKRYVVTNYSCKIHPEWFNNKWTRFNNVKIGHTGCKLCSREKEIERGRLTQDTDETLKEKLEKSPNTTGLTFNNIEFKRELNTTYNTNISFVKNYSCKLHNTWFQNSWVTTNSVMQGNTGCYECGLDRSDRTLQNNQLIQQLKNSPYTTGLTFNDVEFDRAKNTYNQLVIKIKNFSCKKHKWWKQNEWVQKSSVEKGDTGCKICRTEYKDKLLGKTRDVWDGKLDEDENSPYNKWIRKRNNLIQKNWLKISKKEHTDPETEKPKYGYGKVNFNDPNTIKYIQKRGEYEYIKKERHLEIYCPKPNHGYFIQEAYLHKKGAGCPICRESKGEKYLANLFTNNKVKYVRGKDARLGGLIGKKGELLSDFYLTDKKVIVEYDGEQHFRPTFGSSDKSRMDNYIVTYTNDNNRDNFAKTNNDGISLIRISYIMTDEEINVQLFAALRKIGPNEVVKLPIGDYPKRMKPKKILHKDQVDLNKPIYKPRRFKSSTNESKLSLIDTIKNI